MLFNTRETVEPSLSPPTIVSASRNSLFPLNIIKTISGMVHQIDERHPVIWKLLRLRMMVASASESQTYSDRQT